MAGKPSRSAAATASAGISTKPAGSRCSGCPVVSSSSPPRSHGVGSSSSLMWAHRTTRSRPSPPPATSSSSWGSAMMSATVSTWEVASSRSLIGVDDLAAAGDHLAAAVGMRPLHLLPGLVQHRVQDVVDEVELLARRDQRRRQLDHRVAAVVGAADQPRLPQPAREEAAQQVIRLLVVERLLGVLVLDQLQRPEVASSADVAHDRLLAQLLE